MNINCPHCGTEYEVERKYLHKRTTCHVCGKSFLIDSSDSLAYNASSSSGGVDCPQLFVKKVCGSFNLKVNLPLWFKMCFYHWKLRHAVCPACKAETVVLVPNDGTCAFRCDSCGRNVNLEEGVAKSNEICQALQIKSEAIKNHAAQEFASIDDQLVSIRSALKIYEKRKEFYEQVEIFECDWEAYNDKILPERLKFTVESLRTRLSTAHSSIVANSVAQAEASNQTYGTTVGLRDSDNALDGLVRGIVQIGGWAKMMEAESERRHLDDSIEEIQSRLDHAESMMRYYFDLCDEFKGKDKESARRDRLQARCQCDSEDSLPVIDCGKSEESLLSEKKTLERQKKKLENSVRDQVKRIRASQDRRSALKSDAKNRLWRSLLLAFLAVGVFGTAVTLGGCYIHDAAAEARRRRVEAKAWLEAEEMRRAKEAEDARRAEEAEAERKRAKAEEERRRTEEEKRLRIARAEERRLRIEEENRQHLARERAAKLQKIEELFEVEAEIEERKVHINSILGGRLGGDWTGFDANKVISTDASVSISEEPPQKRIAENLSEMDSMGAIDKALFTAHQEVSRLEERLKKLACVKDAYVAKELESRKEACVPCRGTGLLECRKCKGSGEVVGKSMASCPTCRCKGQVKRLSTCGNCHGKGSIAEKCKYCWRQNGVRKKNCYNCGGKGWGDSETCQKCNGGGKIWGHYVCITCQGRGEFMNDCKVVCPACNGNGKLECERCEGRGFAYRPKK